MAATQNLLNYEIYKYSSFSSGYEPQLIIFLFILIVNNQSNEDLYEVFIYFDAFIHFYSENKSTYFICNKKFTVFTATFLLTIHQSKDRVGHRIVAIFLK